MPQIAVSEKKYNVDIWSHMEGSGRLCNTNLKTAGCLPSLKKLDGQTDNPPTGEPPADLPDRPFASPKCHVHKHICYT